MQLFEPFIMDTEKTLWVDKLSCVRQQKRLFTAISFQLYPAEVLLVEGPNGSGKSSLLRLLSGLKTPDEGSIFWDGKPIQALPSEYGHHLHYVGHTNGIKLGLTVIENLKLTYHLSLTPSPPDYASILDRLQLNADKNTLVKFLSAGQKRRLALAKLFLFPKPLWLLDEPLTALDVNIQTLFLSHLNRHLQMGGMAVISSHHPIQLSGANVKALRLPSC
jgi:heme exporter protein A